MIITFAHYKGGTGKTTSCLSIAGWLSRAGKKVLIVDLDPQANATSGLGIDKNSINESIYDVIYKGKDIKKIILESDSGIHIVPSSNDLERVNIVVYKDKSDAFILKKILDPIKDYYDYILIDTPPIHSHFIINGIACADKVFVVLDPSIFSLESLETLKNSFGDFFNRIGLSLEIDGAFITKCPGFSFFKKNHAKEIRAEVEALLGKEVFMIPYSDHVYKSQVIGMPLSHYKSRSKIGKAYKKIALGILEEEND